MQKFIVGLVGVFTLKDLPEDYEKFVEYKATIDKKELDDTVPIAILQVKDTTSYHVLFLDSYNSMEEIDKEIEESLDGEIYNFNVRNILEGHLNGH
ncbi:MULTISPECIES: DUF749 domain-containing protein [Methanosphaera]|uniref:DUF749 domain-containing protein n=2 Tax=Methanosphaera stadtmanae TaxID=2317 RepID=Q2NFK3_METST|nr:MULTISPECIES: DUF749 domain-containing protein [Methanosphaera]ABC57400.1 conserved hypothetical protein [Methanosphaera stadtmanae DSM 3091]MDO5822596.1 DUF749 domain-containing protein [Methanosphaera sp.]MEE0489040.1 DUF749 domain-containing protein [Methanosphaera stadtmanae]OEC92508.1 hypothetical protein A9758_06220 [Methanosphaera sp. A6]RAP02941.1 hypothetical protein CA615_05015 [Methanosphaera stadtmanae]